MTEREAKLEELLEEGVSEEDAAIILADDDLWPNVIPRCRFVLEVRQVWRRAVVTLASLTDSAYYEEAPWDNWTCPWWTALRCFWCSRAPRNLQSRA